MSTENLKELRNALSCWQDDYDCDDDKEQYDMFGAAIDAISRLEVAERANSAQSDHINQQQDRIDSLEQKNAALGNALGTAERERDELRAIAEEQSKLADSNAARAQKAEAEIARRDAAAGEFRKLFTCSGCSAEGLDEPLETRCDCCIDGAEWVESKLYAAAQPAVLPPKYPDELTERAELIEAYSKTQCEIAQELGCDSDQESILKAIYELKELGAQQQNFVELPDRKFRECVNGLLEEAIAYAGTQQLRARLSSRLSNFVKTQRATGVKWEVKK